MDFAVVSKLHGVAAMFFGVVFLLASFGWSLPVMGPEALLLGWDLANPSLVFLTRFLAGAMLGLGMLEWVHAGDEKTKQPFVVYHAVSVVLIMYSSMGAVTYWFGWVYAVLLTVFLIAGVLGKTGGYGAI